MGGFFAGPAFWRPFLRLDLPLGSFQEWIAGFGRKIFGKRYNRMVPARIDKPLRLMRYVVLAWVLLMTATTSRLVFADVCPYDALFTSWTGNAATGGLVLVGVIILLSLVVERPFCKYACPYGALLGFFNRFRPVRLKRNPDTCIDCQQCDLVCPMNLTISDREIVGQHQYIGCLKCTSHGACPVENTVSFQFGFGKNTASGKQSVFTPLLLAVVTFFVFFGGIAAAQSLDLWKSTGSREPVLISQGAFEGTYDPSDIRGAYVFVETSQETIESIIQAPLPELTKTVQGFAEEQGTGFGKIREQLEALPKP